MWSLPDIGKLNAAAAEREEMLKTAGEDPIATKIDPDTGEIFECFCDWDHERCTKPEEDVDPSEEDKAPHLSVEPYYDVFSEAVKGYVAMCEYHRDHYGHPEGYFYCSACDRLMAENYTWERYATILDSEEVCLRCAAERFFDMETGETWEETEIAWLSIEDAKEKFSDFDIVRQAPHVLWVDAPADVIPEGVKEMGVAVFDNMSGKDICGDPSIVDLIEQARDEGYEEVTLVLSAAWQFAVNISVMARKQVEQDHDE